MQRAIAFRGALMRSVSYLPRAMALGGLVLSLAAVDLTTAHGQVAEVVVTARKREENVQNIPVAVTAVSGAQIEKFNLSTVEDVAQKTPQLIIARGSSGSGADISIRGIGAATENIGIEQSVAVNVDGVYYGQGRAIDEGLYDVDGVQVLKGPQALFYGKNATAGAVAIQTRDPTDQREAGLTAGYEFQGVNPYVQGYISGKVLDNFDARLAFRVSDQLDGLIRNTATPGPYTTFDTATLTPGTSPTTAPSKFLGEAKDDLVRLTTKWTPTDRLTITTKATFDQHHSNNNADNTVVIYCPLGYPQSEAGLAVRSSCGRNFQAAQPGLPLNIASVPNSLENKAGGQDFEHYQDGNLYLKINYVAPLFTLTSTNGFQHLINDWADNQNFTNAKLVYGGEHFTWDQFSSEERILTTLKGPLNFAGGFYFQTTSLRFAQDVDFAGAQNSAAPTPQDEFVAYNKSSATTGHTYAVFGQGVLDLIKNVELTGGARYTHETKDSYFKQPYVWPAVYGLFIQYDPADPTAGGGVCNCNSVGAHQKFDNVSPEATLTWRPLETLTLYGAYKTGYKSGGFSNSAILSTGTLAGDLEFKPETSEGFEVGVKSTLFHRQLRVNADLFDFNYSNLQVDFFNTPTFNYVTLNAASARTYGLEYTVEYAPEALKGLYLRLDGAYNNSHYGQFIAPCSPAGITYEQGCTLQRVVNTANGSYTFSPNCGDSAATACNFMDVSGRKTALSPRWTEVVSGSYERPVGTNMLASASVDVRISSSYIANAFPSTVAEQVDSQNAFATLDAVIALGAINRRWQVSLIGRNLTDTFVATSTAGLPLSGGTTGCKISGCGPQVISDQAATIQNPRTVAIQVSFKY
jgi:outer membrane receptor protein involved in Fe transport